MLTNYVQRSGRTGLLWRISSFIPDDPALTLYNSLIYPHLLYVSFILDACYKGVIDKIKVQQNNAVRAVLKAEYRTSCLKLYQDSGIDPIDVSMKKTLVKIVYMGLNNIGAAIYNNMFNFKDHRRELRSSDKLIATIPNMNMTFVEHNVAYRGPMYWNWLPYNIESSPTFDQCKAAVKSYNGFHYI